MKGFGVSRGCWLPSSPMKSIWKAGPTDLLRNARFHGRVKRGSLPPTRCTAGFLDKKQSPCGAILQNFSRRDCIAVNAVLSPEKDWKVILVSMDTL